MITDLLEGNGNQSFEQFSEKNSKNIFRSQSTSCSLQGKTSSSPIMKNSSKLNKYIITL